MTSVAIIDYGSGNLRSVAKAFEHVADGADIAVTSEAKTLDNATHIVLPGVGAFADCMRGLQSLPGMREALERNVRGQKKPFLGICVGMQMLFAEGHEHGVHEGLGWLRGKVVGIGDWGLGIKNTPPKPLIPNPQSLKVPHMGWNELRITHPHPLFSGIESGEHAYFVHSYHAEAAQEDIIATTEYGGGIVAAVARGNVMGTQFHPEKSQDVGLRLLANFLRIR